MAARNFWVALGIALSASACGDAVIPPGVESADALSAAELHRADTELRVVARAMAVALSQEEVRSAVRDALRDSPWDVHQVSLSELVGSPEGEVVLHAAAAAAGETSQRFLTRIQSLPDLDFYMPDRAQRRTWRGTPGVVVAAAINPEAGTVYGFDSKGQLLADALNERAATRPVMLLTAAEPRGRRNKVQAPGMGDVIQSASDGEEAVRYTWTDAAGRVTEIDPGTVSGGRRTGVSMSTSTSGDSTYIDYMYFNATDSGADMEVTVFAKFYRPDGSYLGEWKYANYSFPYQSHWYGHVPLLLPVLPDSSAAYIELRIQEEDGFGNPDEWYGPRKFTWVDRAQVRRMDEESTTSVYVNVELDWVQRAPSVLTSVYVAPVTLSTGSTGSTYAEPRDQYGWKMLNQSVNSWLSGNTSVATVSGSGSTTASVGGVSAGSTSASATISGVTGSGSVWVEEPSSTCDPNLDPFCPA